MADHGRGGRSRGTVRRGLAAALGREARAGRPAFSVGLHERVLAAVAAESRVRAVGPRRSARSFALPGGLAAALACAAFAIGAAWFRAAPRTGVSGAAVADAEMGLGIERLPTLDEIGEGVLAEVTTLAAAAVGVPEFADLAAFDPASLAPADDGGR